MNTLQTLLSGIIDYAGLFPPASLSLEEGLRTFAEYRNHPHNSFLSSRFVVPTAQLPKLTTILGEKPKHSHGALKLSVLLPVPNDPHDVSETLLAAHDSLCSAEASTLVHIESIEFAVPKFAPYKDYLAQIRDLFASRIMFVEVPFGENGAPLLHHVAALHRTETRWGAKFRMGGTKLEQVPACHEVAERLVGAALLGVPWKATAGLHEPIPHFDEKVGARLHGFLNLMAAAAVCFRGERSPVVVAGLLRDLTYADFAFDAEECRLGPVETSRAALAELRHTFALSIGSCSFLEPVAALTKQYPDLMRMKE